MIKVNKVIDSVPYTKSVIPDNRLKYLANKCHEVLQKTPGNVLEIGVYKGGTLLAMADKILPFFSQTKFYGIDTFSGHPYTDGHPVHPVGKYRDVDFVHMQSIIKRRSIQKSVFLFKGKVEEIFKSLDLKNISFAHIDCDLYLPTKFCCDYITKVINHGGMIYFDDYDHEHCPGATRAIEESFPKNLINLVYLEEDDTGWSCFINL
ncbi:TylF/MycF/NovP-related O-methyltransferase [uncultured Desulfosarcina sp.]|uniref:TylF/MycF/NovP-related O-methyltransferase n=1 Tax=uncultured Desulfosarcina sp. TaxID=218289 RepID=UPI0029C96652|nr:TylF/MycF/NovP-related O-methyltransferase [uncultured Desulfosarcina sp.]